MLTLTNKGLHLFLVAIGWHGLFEEHIPAGSGVCPLDASPRPLPSPPSSPNHSLSLASGVEYPRTASDLALKASTATFWVSPSFPPRTGGRSGDLQDVRAIRTVPVRAQKPGTIIRVKTITRHPVSTESTAWMKEGGGSKCMALNLCGLVCPCISRASPRTYLLPES